MKKNLFYYLFTVICSVTLFASCSDDDEKVVNPVPQTTFTGENGLQLTYNGAPMLGKKVTFTPDATNAQKATLLPVHQKQIIVLSLIKVRFQPELWSWL